MLRPWASTIRANHKNPQSPNASLPAQIQYRVRAAVLDLNRATVCYRQLKVPALDWEAIVHTIIGHAQGKSGLGPRPGSVRATNTSQTVRPHSATVGNPSNAQHYTFKRHLSDSMTLTNKGKLCTLWHLQHISSSKLHHWILLREMTVIGKFA